MGCDIHGVFQRRTPEGWADVPTTCASDRHYQLFAVLAGVRNGYGFAGVPRGEAVAPISEPRDLPADFEIADGAHPMTKEAWEADGHAKYYKPGEQGYGTKWMGDHSFSWLSGEEMLAWAERAPIVQHCGVIEWVRWLEWDHREPEEYCGSISGPGLSTIEQIEAEAGRKATHVRVRWHSPLRKELAYFFDEVARLAAAHGEIRFVFGFDS